MTFKDFIKEKRMPATIALLIIVIGAMIYFTITPQAAAQDGLNVMDAKAKIAGNAANPANNAEGSANSAPSGASGTAQSNTQYDTGSDYRSGRQPGTGVLV